MLHSMSMAAFCATRWSAEFNLNREKLIRVLYSVKSFCSRSTLHNATLPAIIAHTYFSHNRNPPASRRAVDNNISMTRRDSCEKDLCGTHPHNNNNHDKAPRFLNTIIAAALDLFACSIHSHHRHKHNARLSCEFAEFSTINHDEGQLLARNFCLLSGVQ